MWTPRWHHVTQWGTAGDPSNGGNNCGEAALTRAFLEYQPDTRQRMAAPEWALVRQVHDPAAAAGPRDLIDRISLLARGRPNGPGNGPTSIDGIVQTLAAFGIHWHAVMTTDVGAFAVIQQAQAAALALLWVDGSALWPVSYGGAYFGGEWGWDHFILSLPDGNLCNDPLSDVPDRASDVRYSWDALQGAVGGAWLLEPPENVANTAQLVADAALKAYPNHLGKPANSVVVQLTAGTVVTLLAGKTPAWQEVRANSGRRGWLLSANLNKRT